MKLLRYLLLILTFSALNVQNSNAQIDTLFWFAAPWVSPDHDGDTQMAFRISSFSNPTNVRIQIPAGSYDTTFFVPANSLASIPVNHLVNQIQSEPADAILNTGVKITSDELITCVYDFISDLITISPGSSNNPETYSLKGQNGMGLEFVVPFQTLWNNKTLPNDSNNDGTIEQPYQYFSIIASEPNTTVYITPRADVVGGYSANTTYSITLPLAGQAYTCQNATQATSLPGNNLSGSIVVADKPVSVTINDDSVNPSGGGGCYDLMGDQIVPTDVIGTEYIVNLGFLNSGSNESFFIVATENFTTVNVNDGAATTQLMNQGDTWQYSVTQPLSYIIADKPVYVIHMSGYGCELGMAIIPPTNCAGSNEVSFARNNNQQFLLNILCESGNETNFAINGNPLLVPPGSFSPVPGTGGAWVGAQIDYPTTDIVPGNQYLINNTSGLFSLGIINGSATGGCLYHYMSSFNRKVITDAGTDLTVCNGEPSIDLTGSVSGGTTTGIWTVLNGTGTLNTPENLTTTYTPSPSDYTQGSLTFILESTGNCDPVADTMIVDFIQSPTVDAGLNNSYCKNNLGPLAINGTVTFAAGSNWTGGSGGAFGNPGSLSTTYTPSPTDINADSVILYLTSAGSFFACPSAEDSVIIHFTEAPAVSAGSDLVICSSQTAINLTGSVTGPTNTGIWTTTGTGSYDQSELDLITDYLVSTTDTTLGNITLTLTSTNNGNCLAEQQTINVSFIDEPDVQITSSDSVCSNLNLLTLSGTISSGFTSTWSTTGFGSIVSPSALTTQYPITSPDTLAGYIDVFLNSVPGICPSVEDSLRIFFVDPPKAYAGSDQDFCSNQLVDLNGSITGITQTGTWSTMGTGTFTPSNTQLNATYIPSPLDLSNGNVNLILTASSAFGCTPDNDIITINFLTAPNASFTFNTACEGENTIFQDASTTSNGTISTWDWDFGDMVTSIAEDPTHTYPGDGTFSTTLIVGGSNGCYDTVSYNVTVNPVPIADFSPTVACADIPITFTDLTFISSGSITSWLYDFGSTISTDQNPSHLFTSTGSQNVNLTVTSDLGCSDDTLLTLFINTPPTADFSFTPNPALVLEDVFFTDASTGVQLTSWLWDFADGEGDNVQNPVHSFFDGGEYQVTMIVTDSNGCYDSITKLVNIALPPVLPSGFTPNGDNENDIFIIRGGPFKSVNFNVYNNWGDLIFTSNDALVGWDGTFNGEPAPLGVYTWTFVVTLANDKVIKQSGDVTLIR
ncbi:MAG: PKD domain-containing protein [Crocinitomicaceae bacterium]|nr:PKD domain-containing protein [Crocinitomicaceae bacterium]